MLKRITPRAYNFIAACQLVEEPCLMHDTRASVIEPCEAEDVRGLIRSLSSEIGDALDVVEAAVCEPQKAFDGFDRKLLDLRSATSDQDPPKDEQENVRMVENLRSFAAKICLAVADGDPSETLAITRNTLKRIGAIRRAVSDALLDLALTENPTQNMFDKAMKEAAEKLNKPSKGKHIKFEDAAAILSHLNVPKSERTLKRWMHGENAPDGFTPECMHSVQSFTEWAKIYANREQSKINVHNALYIDNPKNDRMRKFR